MLNGIEAITTATLSMALDVASLRHQAIANNIANVNTDGYVPHSVSFEGQLDQVRRSLRERGQVDTFALNSVRPRLEPVLPINGHVAKVQLDVEMAHLTQNNVQYQALTKAVSRHLAVLLTAASDGKK